jgi:hypothetical protein
MSYSYAVAYSVADAATKAPTAAGRALAAALAAADAGEAPRLVLPVLLACSNAAVVTDFSQGEQMRLPVTHCDVSDRLSSRVWFQRQVGGLEPWVVPATLTGCGHVLRSGNADTCM